MSNIDRALWLLTYLITAGLIPLILIAYLIIPARLRIDRTRQLIERIRNSKKIEGRHAARNLIEKLAATTAQAIDDRYKWVNYILPLCFISCVLFIGFFLIYTAGEPLYKLQTLDELILNIPVTVYYGFIGGCFFSLFALVGRFHTADITPPLISQLACQTLLAGALAFFAATLFPDLLDPGVAFAAGFIPYKDITDWLTRKAKEKLGVSTNGEPAADEEAVRRRKSDDLLSIDGIAVEHRDRLREEGILTVDNLAMSNPLSLYLSTPYEMQQIIDWIDQAMLLLYIPVGKLEQLSVIGIRGILELRQIRDMEDIPDDVQGNVLDSRLSALATAMGLGSQDVAGVAYLVWQVNGDPQVQLIQSMWEEFGGK